MKGLLRIFSMPLLAKELAEQAARKRTYITRVVYATLLLIGFGFVYYETSRYTGGNPLAMLGRGKRLFEGLVLLQALGILIFLPAMMCTVITSEKERDSLGLLFLTDLRPREILTQKFLSRLTPVVSFLVLSLPMTAVCYAYGGMEKMLVYRMLYVLLLVAIQTGVIALFFSSYCRTTVASFFCTYILGALFYFGPILLHEFRIFRIRPDEYTVIHTPLYMIIETDRNPSDISDMLYYSIPCWIVTFLIFLLARIVFLRRAFVKPRNILRRVFSRLDTLAHHYNRLLGNIVLIRESDPLPDEDPVAWRERVKKSVGQWQYLIRLSLFIEIPLLGIALLIFMAEDHGYYNSGEELSPLILIAWALAALAISVLSANTIAHERSDQTLDVLLTTPIPGESILRQKRSGLQRLLWIFTGALTSLHLMRAWWMSSNHNWQGRDLPLYLLTAACCLGVMIPAISWVSLWIALKVRHRIRAIMVSTSVLVAWVLLPFLCMGIIDELWSLSSKEEIWIALPSPATLLVINETGHSDSEDRILFLIVGGLGTFVLWQFFRRRCLKYADHYLGRV